MSPVVDAPAMVNAHSHAFQRDLRGVAERPAPAAVGGDDFWSWREAMYALAGRLDPDAMAEVGRRAYTEMAASGYGAVGEFHYVHHRPDGSPYPNPNAMAVALADAAQVAGLVVVMLPAAYHRAGWADGHDIPPTPGQRRFVDGTVAAYLERVDALREWASHRAHVHVGVAAHSVRAVPAGWLEAIAAYADAHGLVRHIHAHEQVREVTECRAEHGMTPIELLDRCGFLGARTSVVHAVHVTDRDMSLLADSRTIVVSCPTTEGSLGDGHPPALRFQNAGIRMAIGSDSQVRIDPFEEVRELETLARREGKTRNALLAAYGDLWSEVATNGRASLGLDAPGDAPGPIGIDMGHSDLSGIEHRDLPLALATCASAGVVARRSANHGSLRRG